MLENALDYEGLKYYDGKSKEYIEGYVNGIASNIQTQLDKKAPLASPTLTGAPKAPTAASGTNTTQIATTAFVQTAVKEGLAELIDEAPETMDTLKEVSDAIAEHQEVTDALNSAIGNKVDKVAGKGLSANDFTNEEKEKLKNAVTLTDSQALTNKTYEGYTLGDVCTKGIVNNTSFSDIGYVANTAQDLVPTISTIAYWNGAYNPSKSSNLEYCKKGAFGDAAVKGVDTIPTKNSSNLITSGSVYSELEKKLSKSESASSATTIYNTATNPEDPTNYYIPFFTGTASENKSLLFNGGLSYKCQDGTEDVDGAGILVLGNGVSSGTAGNKYGAVLMWGKDPYFSQINPGSLTANRFITLPDESGIVILNTAKQDLTNKTYNGYTLDEACARGVTNLTTKGSLGLVSLTDDGLKLPTIGTIAWWDGTYNTDGTRSNLTYCTKGAFGDAVTKGILNNTARSSLAYDASTAQNLLPTISTIAWWDGAYNNTNKSNLTYCIKGAFGSAATKEVDITPTKNSTNLITSGGAYAELEKLNFYQKEVDVTWTNGYIKPSDGSISSNNDYVTSNFIKLSYNDILKYRATASDGTLLLAKYDENKNFLGAIETGGKWHVIDRYYHADEDCYVRICKRYTDISGQNCFVVGEHPTYVINKSILVKSPLYGKSMLVIGDSLICGNKNGTDVVWVNQLGMKYNMITYNYGLNGNAISNVSGATGTCMSERYLNIADEVPDVDIIVVEGGANDKNQGCPIGTNTDTTNSTFKGALNVLIDGLRAKYPEKTILFMTTIERYGAHNTTGLTETDYADAMLEVCRLKGIPCFDNIGDSGLSFSDANMSAWIDEGLYRDEIQAPNKHFTPKAYAYLAGKYEKWIEGNLPL